MTLDTFERWLGWVAWPTAALWLAKTGLEYVSFDDVLTVVGIVSSVAGLPRLSGLVGDSE